jgi:hypothetical protein
MNLNEAYIAGQYRFRCSGLNVKLTLFGLVQTATAAVASVVDNGILSISKL